MPFNPKKHHRHSIRLRSYRYSDPGWYFVTICVQDRAKVFGEIVDGKMKLSREGYIARRIWQNGRRIWKNVHLDAFVVMPDHVHMIIQIKSVGATSHVAPDVPRGDMNKIRPHVAPDVPRGPGATRGVAPTANGCVRQSIGAFIGSYKSVVSKKLSHSIWQRNYWERIIRDERELYNVREYIRRNPERAFQPRRFTMRRIKTNKMPPIRSINKSCIVSPMVGW